MIEHQQEQKIGETLPHLPIGYKEKTGDYRFAERFGMEGERVIAEAREVVGGGGGIKFRFGVGIRIAAEMAKGC